jgi:hypothetical protein
VELKPYQQHVINDLSLFLEQVQETKDVKNAFYNFWTKHPKTPLFSVYWHSNRTLQKQCATSVINEIGNMTNIAFWTRNIERKSFRINGFVNHYPDFIIQTKSGKTILLETKGDHLDAEQKIRLGGLWASKAGNNYRYLMVYEKRTVDGAYKLEDFLNIIKGI